MFGGQAQIETHIVSQDPEIDRNTRIVDVAIPGVVKKSMQEDHGWDYQRRKREGNQSETDQEIEDVLAAIRMFYARMHRIDRWALWVSLLALVASFLPWSYVRGEGLVAGIQEYGAASGAAAAMMLLCIYMRTVRRRLSGMILSLQVLAAAGLTAVPIYRFVSSTGVEFRFGLYLTALAGTCAIMLTMARLAVRRS